MSTKAPSLREAYRDWLKIPEAQLPPDHYAILGLPRFEGDAAKVQQATMARMKIVRPRCLKYHELGTQLLNQIAAANVCLTDTAAKAAYDKTLKSGGVTAAVQLASKAGTQERVRLHQLLEEARKERQAAKPAAPAKSNAPAKPGSPSKPAKPARPPVDDDDDTFELTMAEVDEDVIDDEIERLLAEYDLPAERQARQSRRPAAPALGESPFAARGSAAGNDNDVAEWENATAVDSANSLSDQAQALLIAGGLALAALVLIGGLIAFAVSNANSPATAAASGSPGTTPTIGGSAPPPPPASGAGGEIGAAGSFSPTPGSDGGPGSAGYDPGGTSPSSSGIPGFGEGTAPGAGSPGSPFPGAPSGSSPSPASPPVPAGPRLEKFQGMLTRVEPREDRVVLVMQVTRSEYLAAGGAVGDSTPPVPGGFPGAAGPGGLDFGVRGGGIGPPGSGGMDQPITSATNIEVTIPDPSFARQIIDYLTLEEAVDQLLTSGRAADVFNGPGGPATVAATGDSIELVGHKTTDPPANPAALWVVKLQSLEKAGLPESRAEPGKSRPAGTIDESVHASRTPLHQLLRGWNAAAGERVAIGGQVQGAVDADLMLFLVNQSAVSAVVSTATVRSRSQRELLTNNLFTPLDLTASFAGEYDSGNRPILRPASVKAGAVAPGGLGFPGGPGLAGGPGLGGRGKMPSAPAPSGTGGGLGTDPGGSGVAPPPDTTTGEKWYIVRVYDKFSKTSTYEVVYGLEARKQTIENYKLSGVTSYAETGAFKTEEAASARLEILQNKANRKTGGFP